jgi:hypothetical protein
MLLFDWATLKSFPTVLNNVGEGAFRRGSGCARFVQKRFVRERVRAGSTRSAVARAEHPALAHAHLARVGTPLAREFTVAPVALAGSWTHRFTLRVLQFCPMDAAICLTDGAI